ncbi:hydroxymethylbilane synthase [Candidatus Marinamargulisbacteria bacterium SCGC AG-333-B06]|nr:hydroxymethylbilane synthase [Candidatus Marinamargulisbacteria bacterium SCGC AG-333-B06]
MFQTLRIGTRQSKLALHQAKTIQTQLNKHVPDLKTDIIPITTAGDRNQTQPLHELGGKGAFIKAIEKELINGTIDCAVHCLKDVTTTLDGQTELIAFCPAEAVTDCIIMTNGQSYPSLTDLPTGISLATSSLRRQLLLQEYRPDISLKPIRGNIDTRIQTCHDGYADGLMLASAGLIRLQRQNEISVICDPKQIIPAPGQGVVVIQKRRSDSHLNPFLSILNNKQQQEVSLYEQAIIKSIGLSCDYPLGVYATKQANTVTLTACWSDKTCNTFNKQTIYGNTNIIEEKIRDLSHQIKVSLT